MNNEDVQHIYKLNGNIEAQLDFIYDRIWLYENDHNQLDWIDEILKTIDITKIDLSVSLSILIVTFRLKNNLKYRDIFYQRVSEFILANENIKKDHAALLSGLW